MSVFAAAESDLAMSRMGSRSRVLAVVLLSGVFAIALPSTGVADEDEHDGDREEVRTERDADGGIDWDLVKATPPEEWSDELVDQLVAAGHDLDAITERVRRYQREEATRTERDDQQTDLDALGRRIRAAVERGDMTEEEARALWAAASERAEGDDDGDDRLREFQREVIEAAMATPPEEWSDELRAKIARAGWDVDELAEGIRLRQAHNAEQGASRVEVTPQTDENTAVEEESWGRIKAETADSE